jgi:hypothetical protein
MNDFLNWLYSEPDEEFLKTANHLVINEQLSHVEKDILVKWKKSFVPSSVETITGKLLESLQELRINELQRLQISIEISHLDKLISKYQSDLVRVNELETIILDQQLLLRKLESSFMNERELLLSSIPSRGFIIQEYLNVWDDVKPFIFGLNATCSAQSECFSKSEIVLKSWEQLKDVISVLLGFSKSEQYITTDLNTFASISLEECLDAAHYNLVDLLQMIMDKDIHMDSANTSESESLDPARKKAISDINRVMCKINDSSTTMNDLVSQSTDEEKLCAMYEGWTSWI